MINIKKVKLRPEDEIISSWIKSDKTLVSVVCTVYNHEPYLEDAITSFLMQETDFGFEIIIHDDASTDASAEIIKSYQAKYPRIIKPILQTENQYSKGNFKPIPYTASFAKGEYVALCEGDDYWVDNNKIQIQCQQLQLESEINVCCHSSFSLFLDASLKPYCFHNIARSKLEANFIIKGGGGVIPTSSLFIRKRIFDNLPDWFFQKAPFGDYYIQILSSFPNGAIYLPNALSVYRRETENSWSKMYHKNKLNKVKINNRMIDCNLLLAKDLNCPEASNSLNEVNSNALMTNMKILISTLNLNLLLNTLLEYRGIIFSQTFFSLLGKKAFSKWQK